MTKYISFWGLTVSAVIGLFLNLNLFVPVANAYGEIATTTDSLALHSLNNVLVANNALHVVYTSGTELFYSNSTNGVDWSTPISLGVGWNPMIATANGVVGVAYKNNSNVYYRYQFGVNNWSAPILIGFTGDDISSMTGYGTDMFVSSYMGYFRFSATGTNVVYNLTPILVCSAYTPLRSQIAVSALSATDSNPLVRLVIAYNYECSPDPAQSIISIYQHNPTGQGTAVGWKLAPLVYGGAPTNSIPSLSIVSHPTNGDFYLSGFWGSNASLWYDNAWDDVVGFDVNLPIASWNQYRFSN